MPGNQFEKEKEAWIEMGAQSPKVRLQVQGIQLCDCNTEFVMAPFQACLPNGWGLADAIAPGIFDSLKQRSIQKDGS
jgi:hypothetical protein